VVFMAAEETSLDHRYLNDSHDRYEIRQQEPIDILVEEVINKLQNRDYIVLHRQVFDLAGDPNLLYECSDHNLKCLYSALIACVKPNIAEAHLTKALEVL
jgi:hypothetical protein